MGGMRLLTPRSGAFARVQQKFNTGARHVYKRIAVLAGR
jgi:hypothetical protein